MELYSHDGGLTWTDDPFPPEVKKENLLSGSPSSFVKEVTPVIKSEPITPKKEEKNMATPVFKIYDPNEKVEPELLLSLEQDGPKVNVVGEIKGTSTKVVILYFNPETRKYRRVADPARRLKDFFDYEESGPKKDCVKEYS